MALDDMIFSRLKDDATLASMLASYDQRAAVFYQQAPERSNSAWGSVQYPRVDFVVDMRDDPVHGSAATLDVSIWCAEQSQHAPEQIERVIRALLNGTFAKPVDGTLCCLSWLQSGAFNGNREDEKDGHTFGVMMQFAIKELPVQEIFDPDPVSAICAWLKEKRGAYTVIGADDISGWLSPTTEAPVVYWNLTDVKAERETNCCVWYDCAMSGHVFAPTATERFAVACSIVDDIAMESRILMSDGSPMLPSGCMCDAEADSLNKGQISMRVRFGVLRSVRQPYNPTKARNLTFVAP